MQTMIHDGTAFIISKMCNSSQNSSGIAYFVLNLGK